MGRLALLAFLVNIYCLTDAYVFEDVYDFFEHCPSGWRYHESKCYRYTVISSNYFNAKLECQGYGGDLAILDSRQKIKFMEKAYGNPSLWIGIHRETRDYGYWSYKYADGQQMMEKYSRWSGTNPNAASYDCAYYSSYMFYDYPCTSSKHGLCEIDAIVRDNRYPDGMCMKTVSVVEKSKFFLMEDVELQLDTPKCHRLCTDNRLLYSAFSNVYGCMCLEELPVDAECDMSLLNTTDPLTEILVRPTYHLPDGQSPFEISTLNLTCEHEEMVYYNGKCYYWQKSNYHYLHHQLKAVELFGENTALVKIETLAEDRFIDEVLLATWNHNDWDLYYGLRIHLGGGDTRLFCDEGWFGFDGACFKYFGSNASGTYDEMRAHCQGVREGADLMWYEGSAEQTALQIMFPDWDQHRTEFWSGIYDYNNARDWRYPMWKDSTGHRPWYDGNEGVVVNERCAWIRSDESFKLRDVNCARVYPAMCRYNPGGSRGSDGIQDWSWYDGEKLVDSTYHHFKYSQPGSTIVQCFVKETDLLWHDYTCESAQDGIYEKSAVSANRTIMPDGLMELFVPFELKLNYHGGPDKHTSVSYEERDLPFDWYKSFDTFVGHPTKMGKNVITYQTVNWYGHAYNGSMMYDAVLPVKKVKVSCPAMAVGTNVTECVVYGAGSAMSGTLSITDGQSFDISLEDSTVYRVGPNMEGWVSSSNWNPSTSKSWAMFGSRFDYHGVVLAFDVEVTYRGLIQFIIWRPTCDPGYTYCVKSMTCVESNFKYDVCAQESVARWNKTACGSNKWSLTLRQCVGSNGIPVAQTPLHHGHFAQHSKMINVGEVTFYATNPGRHMFQLNEEQQIEVLPGDILGWRGQGAYVSWRNPTSQTRTSYATGSTYQKWPENGIGTTVDEFMINAWVARYSSMKVYTIVNDEGIFNYSFSATNEYTDGEVYNETSVDVLLEVKDAFINSTGFETPFGCCTVTMDFDEPIGVVESHVGTRPVYEWDFGDGETLVTTAKDITHKWKTAGWVTVTLHTYNNISDFYHSLEILVQGAIEAATFTAKALEEKYLETSWYKICVDKGNSINFTFSLNHTDVDDVWVFEQEPKACQSGWQTIEGTCYKEISGNFNFSHALTACQSEYHRSYPATFAKASHAIGSGLSNGETRWSGFYIDSDGVVREYNGRKVLTTDWVNWEDSNAAAAATDECVRMYNYGSNILWRFGDCSTEQGVTCEYVPHCEEFVLMIPNPGTYVVELSVFNFVSSFEQTNIQYVLTVVKGMEIVSIPAQRFTDDIEINFSIESGSGIIIECHHGEDNTAPACANVEFNESPIGLRGTGKVTITESEYKIIGDHKVFIMAKNLVTNVSAVLEYEVQYEITDVTLESDVVCAMTNEQEVTWTLDAKQGSRMTAVVFFNDVDATLNTTHAVDLLLQAMPNTDNLVVKHSYPNIGTYTTKIIIFNDINTVTIEKDILIEHPIRGYRYETNTPIKIFPDEPAEVIYSLIFDDTLDRIDANVATSLPTSVHKSYSYGGPDCRELLASQTTPPLPVTVTSYNSTTGNVSYTMPNGTTVTERTSSTVQLSSLTSQSNNLTTTTQFQTTTLPMTTQELVQTTPNMWLIEGQLCPMALHNSSVTVLAGTPDNEAWNYTSYGTYEFVSDFSNCVSDNQIVFSIDVDQPVLNLTLESNETRVEWNTSTLLSMGMDWGSRVQLLWEWDDGNPSVQTVYDRFEVNEEIHLWNVEGTFYPIIFTNNTVGYVNKTTGPIYVQRALFDILYFETTPTQFMLDPEYATEVKFTVYLKAEHADAMATNVTANVSFADGHELNDQYFPDVAQFDSSKDKSNGDRHVWTFSHEYTIGDTYNVTMSLWNFVSDLNISYEFTLIEELIDMQQHALIVSHLDLQITPDVYDTDEHIARWFHTEDHDEHIQTYTSDELRELLGLWVHVQQNGYISTTPAPTVTTAGSVTANNADNTTITSAPSATTTTAKDIADANVPDLQPPLTIRDLETVKQKIAELKLEIEYNEVELHAYIIRYMFANDQTSVLDHVKTGFTAFDDQDRSFPIEKPLTIYANFSRGTHLSYTWSWGDDQSDNTDQALYTHVYGHPGTYVVTVNVTNKFNWMTYSTTVNIQRSVKNLEFVEGPDIVSRNRTAQWTIDLGTIGTDACYLIDFKDRADDAPPRYMFLGDKQQCYKYFPVEMAAFFPLRMIVATNEELEDLVHHGGYARYETSFKYMSLGMFQVTFTGINRVSMMTVTKNIAVTKGPCSPSLVELSSQNPCLNDELCVNDETMSYKSNELHLKSYVKHNCEITQQAWFTWTLYTVDVHGDMQQIVPANMTMRSLTLRTLKFPALLLDYGRYFATLNVTMYGEDIFAMEEMYFHIGKTPLRSSLNGEKTIKYQRKQYMTNYTLDALTWTEDPDEPGTKDGIEFFWTCRRSCETFPPMDDDYNAVGRMDSECEALNLTYYVAEDGTIGAGCFMTDDYDQSGKFTESNDGVQIINLGDAYEWDMIVIEIHIKKDTRYTMIKQSLTITQGAPPEIEPNLCVSNCRDKVNYAEIFSMSARVKTPGVYVYRWSIHKNGAVDDLFDRTTEEVPPERWQDNAPVDNPDKSMVPTGYKTATFAIEPNFFTFDDINFYFYIVVICYRLNGDPNNYGMAVLPFQPNEPPLQGNCTASPLNGTALESLYNVNCSIFYDQHKPVLYQVGYRAVGATSPKITFTEYSFNAMLPGGGIVLSQGIKSEDYQMEIYVRAKDNIGGSTLSEPMIVTVMPAPVENIGNALGNIDSLASSGDTSTALQVMSAVSNGMNSQVGEVKVDLASMTDEERAAYEEEQALAEAESARIKEQMLSVSTQIDLADSSAVNSVNSAVGSMMAVPSQVSAHGRASAATVLQNSLNILNTTSGNLDAAGMNEVCQNLVATAAGGASASAYAVSAEGAQDDELTDSILAFANALSLTADLAGRTKVEGEGDTVLITDTMVMGIMKQFHAALLHGIKAGAGDANNGADLPGADELLGTGNGSSNSLRASSNLFGSANKPFVSPSANTNPNQTDTGVSGFLYGMNLKGDGDVPLNLTRKLDEKVHINMVRSPDEIAEPTKVINDANKRGDPIKQPTKLHLPRNSSLHMQLKRAFNLTGMNTTIAPDLNSSDSSSNSRRKRSVTSLDPLLGSASENVTFNIDDYQLMWTVFFRKEKKPSATFHDFNCTLPIIYYDLNENTTLAIGGTVWNTGCDDLLAENPNATCERAALNRNIYPKNRHIVETNDQQCFIPDTWIQSADDVKVYIGVQYFYMNISNSTFENITEHQIREGQFPEFDIIELPEDYEETPVQYEMEIFAASCKYWDPFLGDYTTNGCEVGPLTQPNVTHCICEYLQPPIPEDTGDDPDYYTKLEKAQNTPGITFASSLVMPFNEIDLSFSAFSNLADNPLVFSVMVGIMCGYLCCCVWAAAQDKKDAIKAGVSPLLDNDPRDRYLYELTFYTGNRSSSGTTAKVSMILSGEEDETQPRLIFDDKRSVLQTGGVDGFVMATPRCLGSLSHMRIWHDNSGKSPGWFLSRLQVVDMQTLDKYFFILDRWLSASEDDGILDRVVPLAGKDELTGFSHLFFTKARKDLMDGHIWFSVFGKPHKSNFTRIQRLTCCLCLLFSSMVANIALWQGDEETGSSQILRIGPLELSIMEIAMGIVSSLIAFPINIVIAMIFKFTRPPPYNWKKKCCAPCKKKKRNSARDELLQQAQFLDGGHDANRMMVGSRASFASLNQIEDDYEDAKANEMAKRRDKKKFKLPWGFLIVNYTLCLGVVIVAFMFTVQFAGGFGPKKSAKWLGSFCTSIVESIFLSQPIKVVFLALFYALVIKKPDEDENADPGLEKGEEYLHKHEKASAKLNATHRRKLHKFKTIPIPPTEEYLQAARQMRLKEVKMMELIREIVLYVIFMYLLIMVSYGNRDPAAHSLYSALYTEFHDAAYVEGPAFDDVVEYKTFWNYVNQTLIPSLWPDEWYDGMVRHQEFTADKNMYRVGVPRLRQLRMVSEQCNMPMYKYVKECSVPYSLFGEDETSYYPGWIPVTNESAPNYDGPYDGWFWQSGGELDGFPFTGEGATYGGGGYNIELGSTRNKAQRIINELYDNVWLTPETRAIVIEFVLYNANMNLFAISSMTFEFLPTGAIVPVYKMQLIRLDRYIGTFMLTVMIAEILTFLYIIYYMYREIMKFKKDGYKKYFKSFWNCVEVINVGLCLVMVGMFFYRFYMTDKTSTEFRENRKKFVSFSYAATTEELYGYMLSFIIFTVTAKFLKILRFNKRMSSLGMTLGLIIKPLLSFLLALGIAFLAFAQMAYMVYCKVLLKFSTFLSSVFTLYSLMLNKFDYKELEEANSVAAPFIFLSFVVLMSWILLSFMITIICDGFAQVQDELQKKENAYEVVDFIVNKFKGAIGVGTGPQLPAMNKSPESMDNGNHGEVMDKLQDLEEVFRDFCSDESKGDENLVAKYEKEIIVARRAARIKHIYTA